jgi:hypothetical protein
MDVNTKQSTLSFVVQEHLEDGVFHWDLMLHRPVSAVSDDERVLATWKLDQPPTKDHLAQPMRAVPLPDHRKAYLTYEGPIHQGRRGSCRIVDKGTFELCEQSADRWQIIFDGGWLKGEAILQKSPSAEVWTLRYSSPSKK